MAPSRRSKASITTPFSSSLIPAISAVAVAQICESNGYKAAEPAALRSLSSVAHLYIQTLATSAASIAALKGRSQTNILDLIRALELLIISSDGGFPGASDPTTPLLRSSVVKGLRSFVRSVKEVPFAKPIPRRGLDLVHARVSPASFAAMGREPPAGHVPRWLPCFPEGWRKGEERRERAEERTRWEDKGRIFKDEVVEVGGVRGRNNGLELKIEQKELVSLLGRESERVRFELGFNKSNHSLRRSKLKRLVLGDDEDECEYIWRGKS